MNFRDFKRELFSVSCDMQKLMHDMLSPICREHGLTMQQMHVLVKLAGLPGQTSSQLSESAGILRTNFSNVCRKLEKQGLVQRHQSTHDRRVSELSVTEEGRALLAVIDGEIERRYGMVFESEPQQTFDDIATGVRALLAFSAKLER